MTERGWVKVRGSWSQEHETLIITVAFLLLACVLVGGVLWIAGCSSYKPAGVPGFHWVNGYYGGCDFLYDDQSHVEVGSVCTAFGSGDAFDKVHGIERDFDSKEYAKQWVEKQVAP